MDRITPDVPAYNPYSWEKRSRVYFITGKTGPIKIGVAIDLQRRLQVIQTGSHRKLVVAADIPGGYEQERYLHEFYKRERMYGEWSRRSLRLTEYLVTLMDAEAEKLARQKGRHAEVHY